MTIFDAAGHYLPVPLRTCIRCGNVLVDEDELGPYYQVPVHDPRIPGLTFMDRVHECDGQRHTVRPRHTQLMDPVTSVQEYIESSIYYYPLLFPTRTEVLDHTFLGVGIGFDWTPEGQLCSVFSHIEPDYDRWYNYDDELRPLEELMAACTDDASRAILQRHVAKVREEEARLRGIRADYVHLARTYGPPRLTEQVPGPGNGHLRQARTISRDHLERWTMLGRMPRNAEPAWQAAADEVRELFAPCFTEQGALW